MNYGAGALALIVITVGVILILAGSGAFSPTLNISVGTVLTVFGIYTIVFGALSGDKLYYTSWGVIFSVAGLTIAASHILNPLLGLGVALLLIGILAIMLARGRSLGKR
ncbi:MAG: hypothetical protein QXO86_05950 [Nitrososphaerota archaeon]